MFGEPTVPVRDEHAVDYLVRTLMADGEDITLVPIGPLTNIAAALIREPRIADRAREVVLMGGAYTRGNVTPAAEFNIAGRPGGGRAGVRRGLAGDHGRPGPDPPGGGAPPRWWTGSARWTPA